MSEHKGQVGVAMVRYPPWISPPALSVLLFPLCPTQPNEERNVLEEARGFVPRVAPAPAEVARGGRSLCFCPQPPWTVLYPLNPSIMPALQHFCIRCVCTGSSCGPRCCHSNTHGSTYPAGRTSGQRRYEGEGAASGLSHGPTAGSQSQTGRGGKRRCLALGPQKGV